MLHHEKVKDAHLTAREVQNARRQAALERQRASRSALFDLSRGAGLDNALDELELGQEEDDESMPGITEAHIAPQKLDKVSRARLKWQKRYADKLMFAETIDALPHDLDTHWLALAVPQGKRCLALTLSAGDQPQTLLLSRSKGRPLARRFTTLPFGTILDCVWDQQRSILFVLDALEWNGLPLGGMDSEARRFWRDNKLAELSPQPVLEGIAGERRLLVVPVPASDSPRTFLGDAIGGRLCSTVSIIPIPEKGSMDEDLPKLPTAENLSVPLPLDGVLLYLREALYESGLTCLAGWLPLEGGRLVGAVSALNDSMATS